MGIANIIEKHTKKGFEFVWDKIRLQKIPDIPIQQQKYSKGFVSLGVIVGLISLGVYANQLRLLRNRKVKPLDKLQLQTKYGKNSWAIISDVRYCLDYVIYLSKNGFNLILMGQTEDLQKASQAAYSANNNIQIIKHKINWIEQSKYLATYQEIERITCKYDVSILVVPKIQFTAEEYKIIQSGSIRYPPIQSGIMLSRFLGPKMSWRSYQSLIIFPSKDVSQEIQQGQGLIKGAQLAYDGFGQNLSYELNLDRLCGVIVARGRVQNAFTDAGENRVSN